MKEKSLFIVINWKSFSMLNMFMTHLLSYLSCFYRYKHRLLHWVLRCVHVCAWTYHRTYYFFINYFPFISPLHLHTTLILFERCEQVGYNAYEFHLRIVKGYKIFVIKIGGWVRWRWEPLLEPHWALQVSALSQLPVPLNHIVIFCIIVCISPSESKLLHGREGACLVYNCA